MRLWVSLFKTAKPSSLGLDHSEEVVRRDRDRQIDGQIEIDERSWSVPGPHQATVGQTDMVSCEAAVLYCTVHSSTVQYHTHYCTALYNAARQYSAVQYCSTTQGQEVTYDGKSADGIKQSKQPVQVYIDIYMYIYVNYIWAILQYIGYIQVYNVCYILAIL